MSKNFFGSFLVEKKVLTQKQLDSATAYQKQHNILLGNLAVKKEYMTPEQVKEVISLQKKSDLKFGNLAVEKNYLTSTKLRELLKLQADNYLFLGEAIVKKGILNGKIINEYINEYTRQIKQKAMLFSQDLESAPSKELLKTALKLTLNYFYRLGLRSKADSIIGKKNINYSVSEIVSGYNFFTKQQINNEDYLFGFIIPRDSFDPIVSILLNEYQSLSFEGKYDFFSEQVYLINFLLCKKLKQKGYNAKHSITDSKNLVSGDSTIVKIETTIAPFYLIYYKFPNN